MEKEFNEIKELIILSLKRVNKLDNKTFKSVLDNINKELSEYEDIEAYKYGENTISIKFQSEDFAHIGVIYKEDTETFFIFDDETEIVFFE